MFDLRIDIESVDPDDDCSRPVNDVLLLESEEADTIEKQFCRLQGIFPNTDCDGINAAGLNANATIYTVFIYKIDEAESHEYYEELDLARFTNLKKAKELMREVIGSMNKD